MKNLIITSLALLLSTLSIAQNQGPSPRGGDPSRMVEMEKKLILDSISGINEDQRLIIDQIYKDYEASIAALMSEMQNSGDREAIREKMMTIQEGKREALKAILTEDQFQEYESLAREARERMRKRARSGRGNE